jgi:hypothetical protein
MNRATFLDRRGMHPLAARWAWLDDYRLCFNVPVGPGERGVANVEWAPGARTCGVAYLLTVDEAHRLDRTEAVHAGLYRRMPVEVLVERECRLATFTYQSSMTAVGRKPSPRYMRLLVEGARHHELPAEYVAFLESFELARDERTAAEQEKIP